jgi:predicted XRE-type DNA-binding protein
MQWPLRRGVESNDGNAYRAVYGSIRKGSEITGSTMAKRRPESAAITRGSINIFEDLGYPDAAERRAKLRLAYVLNQVLEARKLSQADAAKVLGVTQPKVSALRHYKLAGFSVERVMNLLTALDQDVEIVIRRKPRSRKAGRISVVAA